MYVIFSMICIIFAFFHYVFRLLRALLICGCEFKHVCMQTQAAGVLFVCPEPPSHQKRHPLPNANENWCIV